MKWRGLPPWYNDPSDKSDLMDVILRWEAYKTKEKKKLKREEDEKGKKGHWIEDPKPKTFTVLQLCIYIIAIGPLVGTAQILAFFFLLKTIGEHLFK